MGALPPIKRITKEDLQDAPDWITRLLYPLNLFFDSVYNNLNKGLTFTDNILSQTINFTITAGASASANTAKFTVTMKQKPEGLLLLNATLRSNNYTPIGSAVFIEWYFDGTYINITSITGLADGSIYDFVIRLI